MSFGAARSGKTVRVGLGWERFGAAPDPDRFWAYVEAMERIGYDSLWLSDTATGAGLAPLPALAAVAARTERMKLGTSVLAVPARNPVLLAKEMASVDCLSGGRFLPAFGLGVNFPAERKALGVEPGERVSRMVEAMAIIRALWPGEPVDFDGEHWSLENVRLTPKPTREKLEIWLGGTAPKALERIGRIAEGWLASFLSAAEFGAGVEAINHSAAAAERGIDYDHYGMTLFAAPSREEIPDAALRVLNRREGLTQGDHVAIGSRELRDLLERFREAGAMKFVVIPIAEEPIDWIEEMFEVAVRPVEAAG